MLKKNILFIGYGEMGSVIGESINSDLYNVFYTENNDNERTNLKAKRIEINEINSIKFKYVILCIKPQNAMNVISNDYKSFFDNIDKQKTVIISIMGGITLDSLANFFGKDQIVIRTMPNIGIKYGKGITYYSSNKILNKEQESHLNNIFANNESEIFSLSCDSKMSYVTALTGSGLMYYMCLVDALCKAMPDDFDKDNIAHVAKKMLDSSFEILNQSNKTPSEIIKQIATPSGITEAAFIKIQELEFYKIIKDAIKSSVSRSNELSM